MEKNNDKIRVMINFDGINHNYYLAPDFHHVPRVGDLIDAQHMVDEKDFSEDELSEIYRLSWGVINVNWGKDQDGFLVELICCGE